MKDLGQLITAMVTPFNKDLEVDYGKAAQLALHLADNGSDGILVAGTTGESPALTHDEKIRLFQVIKETVGDRVSIIAGTGYNNTRDTVKLTQEAEALGVDAALVVCPYYNKPPQEGIYRHFETTAKSTNLPVIVYNIPGRTGVNITPETMARLAEIPNIVADKEAAGSVEQCSQMVAATGAEASFKRYFTGAKTAHAKSFAIYSGDDSLTLPMLSVGAVGVISVTSHVAGRQMKEMINAYFKGDVVTALSLHYKLLPLFKGLFAVTNPILIKTALAMMGMDMGALRSPLVEATKKQKDDLSKLLKETGIL